MKTVLQTNRRGLVLMMVMVIMALLATLVMSFLMMVSQTRIPEDKGELLGGTRDVYPALSKKAIEQLLVGSDDGTSVIGPHSILENLYGHPVYYDDTTGNRIDQLELSLSPLIVSTSINGTLTFRAPKAWAYDTTTIVKRLSQIGTVFTIISADVNNPSWDLTGKSLRVVHIEYTDPDLHFYLAPCEGTVANFDGYEGDYIINGAPFSGTGIGFDIAATAGTPRLALEDGDSVTGNKVYSALRPNPLAPTGGAWAADNILGRTPLPTTIPASDYNPFQEYLYSLRYGLTSANPDYTDADYNTMFLAKQTLSALPANMGQVISIMPSFHRPGNITATAGQWEKLRKEMMRPLPYDHPEFTGGTPQLKWNAGWAANLTLFSRLLGDPMDIAATPVSAYDVDNDGDGVAESIWMNVGLPLQTLADADGVDRTYQPLVSYLVLDLDGRIDINAHGRYVFDDPSEPGDSKGFFGGLTGSGSGPAEMDLSGLDRLIEGNAIATGRYGTDHEPFTPTAGDPIPRYPFERYPGTDLDLPNHLIFGGRIPDLWGTMSANFDPADVLALTPANDPALDRLGQRVFRDTSGSLGTNLLTSNPYLFNPNPADARWQDWDPNWAPDDSVFKLDEFASLLCSRDIGGLQMPRRVRELLFTTNGMYPDAPPANDNYLRNWLTAITADIPSPPMSIGKDLSIYDRILKMVAVVPATPTPTEIDNFWLIYNALPDDIRAGRKIDINYASTINATTPANPATTYHARVLEEKARFAQSLFVLLCVICDDEIQAYTTNAHDFGTGNDHVSTTPQEFVYKRLAQWCINIVDFTDTDEIMTPFVIPKNPTRASLFTTPTTPTWINATDNILAATPSLNTNHQALWGLERPNIVITETLAMHNRRTNYIAPASSSAPAKRSQVGTSQGSAFIELYNASTTNAAYNDPANSNTRENVNLAATGTTASVTTFVWRLAIGSVINDGVASGIDLRDDYVSSSTTIKRDTDLPTTPDRYVWFGLAANIPGAFLAQSYFPIAPVASINPNDYLVIGSRPVTSTKSGAAPATDPTNRNDEAIIDLVELVDPLLVKPTQTMIAANGATDFNISESPSAPTLLNDIDGIANSDSDLHNNYVDTIGRIPMYKPVFLQRLADPTQAYNVVSNPYITVDWSVFDLTVFDSEDNTPGDLTIPPHIANPISSPAPAVPPLASRQWGISPGLTGNYPNLWSRQLNSDNFTDTGGTAVGTPPTSPTLLKWDWASDASFQNATFTLGYLNSYASFSASDRPVAAFGTIYHGRPPEPFTYLHWNDAPLASSLEVMQVPASSPGRFGLEFDPTAAAGYPATSHGSLGHFTTFSHRLNFFHANDLAPSLNLAKIFDYIAVPSLFAGTVDPATGVPRYREPGKVNLNTMNELTYDALVGSRTKADFLNDPPQASDVVTLRDQYPFRAADAFDKIPTGYTVPSAVDTSLLRSNATNPTSGDPLFSQNANTADNTQQALESLQRLSEMTTNRSNTFAVWVTIGLFEVVGVDDPTTTITENLPISGSGTIGATRLGWFCTASFPDYTHLQTLYAAKRAVDPDDAYDYFRAVYPNGYFLGKERGSDGEAAAYRFRDLYIIDRTIPVGFRRGELHNSRNTIIHRERLQR